MTCSKNFGRLLQASCLGLIGALTVVGCGGSESTPNKDSSVGDGGTGTGIASVTVSPPSADLGNVVKGFVQYHSDGHHSDEQGIGNLAQPIGHRPICGRRARPVGP